MTDALDRPLSRLQKVSYGVGDLAMTFFFQATFLYLFYFYTDIATIPPTK